MNAPAFTPNRPPVLAGLLINHMPYRPSGPDDALLRYLRPWDCKTCWVPRDPNVNPVRVQWPCRWAFMELRDKALGTVQHLLSTALSQAARDLRMPERDLHWRFFGSLVVPENTQKLRVVAAPNGPGAGKGRGGPPAPARPRSRR